MEDGWSVGESKNIKARTLRRAPIRRCCECRKTILPGDTYNRTRGCWEGKWSTFASCEACDDLRHELADEDYMMAPFGHLSDWAANAGIEFVVEE